MAMGVRKLKQKLCLCNNTDTNIETSPAIFSIEYLRGVLLKFCNNI